MATRYVDNTKETGTLTGNNWQFTNASTTVTETGAAGNAQAELAAGNYVRTNGGTQWYRVDSITDDDNFEIAVAFQQVTNTDTCKYNSENGQGTATAFAHIHQATKEEARSAGDVIKMRANQTHTHAADSLGIDENGTVNSYITLKGCDSIDDPWSDGSDVRPIIDFGNTTAYFPISKNFWRFEHLDFKNSTFANSAVRLNGWGPAVLDDCRFYDNTARGAEVVYRGQGQFLDCVFDNNNSINLAVTDGGSIEISGCTFDGDTVGGGAGTNYGLYVSGSGRVVIKDSTFGVTDDHDNCDIYIACNSYVRGRNVKLDSATEVTLGALLGTLSGVVYLEDDEQTHEAFRAWTDTGNLTRTTAVNRAGVGGSPWSMLGEPNANCGAEEALYLIGDWLRGVPIYLDGTQQTITVYAYATSWAALPNVNEFVVELEHYEGAADWDIDVTADTFAANDQWESFAITLTPGDSGPAYLRVYLKDYEDGTEKIYVDPEPVIT